MILNGWPSYVHLPSSGTAGMQWLPCLSEVSGMKHSFIHARQEALCWLTCLSGDYGDFFSYFSCWVGSIEREHRELIGIWALWKRYLLMGQRRSAAFSARSSVALRVSLKNPLILSEQESSSRKEKQEKNPREARHVLIPNQILCTLVTEIRNKLKFELSMGWIGALFPKQTLPVFVALSC